MLRAGRHMEAPGSLQRKSVACHTSSLRSALLVMRPHFNLRLMSSATPSLEGLASRSTSQRRRTTAKAAAQESSGHSKEVALPPGLLEMTVLGGLFATWYLANIVFNIYNKEVLKVFPFPMTCTTVQFLVGSVLAIFCWVTGLCKAPQLSSKLLTRIAPLALVHTLGNLLTNMSLGAVAVSFTHTIKAMEPIFSVGLSAVFLHDYPHPLVILTLLPIIGGVVMASISEATFNWFGFSSAMASNLTFQSRNVLSKKMMAKETETAGSGSGSTTTGTSKSQGLDNINLFGIITCMSFLMLLPVNLAVEGWGLTPTALQTMGITNPTMVITQAVITGLCFHAYQQVSYMILSRVTPVTHSIGNCVKRVVVIVASVLFFKNPMTTQSATGTAIALLGVFAYSQAKRMTGKAKAKAA